MLVSSAIASAVAPASLFGAAVRVRAPEGSAHGFLVLRGTEANVLAEGDWWQIPVGGGIVAQSNPGHEYEETWHKAEGMLRSLVE